MYHVWRWENEGSSKRNYGRYKKKYIFPVYKILYIDEKKKEELIPVEGLREKQENMREDVWIKDIFVHRRASKLFGQEWLMVVIVLKSDFNS